MNGEDVNHWWDSYPGSAMALVMRTRGRMVILSGIHLISILPFRILTKTLTTRMPRMRMDGRVDGKNLSQESQDLWWGQASHR